jgi:hypothetical protein
MESIIRNVKDIESDKRQWLESAVGHQLQDNQQIIIRILSPGTPPDQQTKEQALSDLQRLSEQGTRHREALGVSEEEADKALDEAMRHVRRRESD